MIEEIKKHWKTVLEKINTVFSSIKDSSTRKEFALKAIKYPFKHVLFSFLDGSKIEELRLDWENVKTW